MRELILCGALICVLSVAGCSSDRPDTVTPRFPDMAAETDADEPAGPASVPDSQVPGPSSPVFADKVLDVVPVESVPLVVDQFGYLPGERKIAVLRDPRIGFDSAAAVLVPDETYYLVDVESGEQRLAMSPQPWNGGAVDVGSGDRVWWLDFSSIRQAGDYRIEDETGAALSGPFRIGDDVYDELLAQALRTFYYQRAGFAKDVPWADARWADGASHLGPGQDSQARRYDAPLDASTERDLSGGWYDAGDYNRYTHWAAGYILQLLHAWHENPAVWTDDIGIPESGNGIPDLLDEVIWGLDWLARMQEADGSLLSVLDVDEASPPSSATGPSRYGPASTAATLGGAAAFAYAASRFADSGIDDLVEQAQNLRSRAEAAWAWAAENPSVSFRNNDPDAGTEGVGAGQQEPDARGLARLKLSAAIYLYEATSDERFRGEVSSTLPDTLLIGSRYVSPFISATQRDVLFYADNAPRDPFEVDRIQGSYLEAMADPRFFSATGGRRDAYLSFLDEYVWGSNGFRAKKGLMYLELLRYGLGERDSGAVRQKALDQLHYLHGLNPLGLVYLTNTAEYGAERSIGTVYHRWFVDGSAAWDSVERSRYGPLPGLLVAGPNPTYRPASCCPASCGLPDENERCALATAPPSVGQPNQKAFSQWNEGFPLNSWQQTENSNGYQASYLRLLAWFASAARP